MRIELGEAGDGPRRLPFNRKERYFTGTVLPMLVACDEMRHLGLFLKLCGLPPVWDPTDPGASQLQFLTEYGFMESVFTPEDRTFWPDAVDAATPDVVIAGRDWLLAVEAKMYHNPTAADLAIQMGRQSLVVETWVSRLGLDPSRVVHVLLLPSKLAEKSETPGWSVVTWESLLEAYRSRAPAGADPSTRPAPDPRPQPDPRPHQTRARSQNRRRSRLGTLPALITTQPLTPPPAAPGVTARASADPPTPDRLLRC